MKVFERVYVPVVIDYISEHGLVHGDPSDHPIADVLPDSPALPNISRWLVDNFDEDKLEAVTAGIDGVVMWADGLRDNSTQEDLIDAERLDQMVVILRSLVAALSAGPETDR